MKLLDGFKVYVQVKDVVALQRLGFTMPIDTYAVISNIQSETRLKGRDFISFEEPSAIAYFKGINWILDAGVYWYKSLSEIKQESKKLERRIAFSEEMLNRSEEKDLMDWYEEREMEKHKLNQLKVLISLKSRKCTLSLPVDISSVIKPKINTL